MLKLLVILFLFVNQLYSAPSKTTLQALIIGKVAKFITWENTNNDTFVITILKNPFHDLLDKIYKSKKINSKNVKIIYINTLDDLKYTNILYIPNSEAPNLKNILKKVTGKNILTVSDIRGFAEKHGILQFYFVSQKLKLKINLDVAKREKLKIKSSLLRIATVIKGEKP